MKISNNDIPFFGKKKKTKTLPSLEAIKLVSFVTGTALAANKALKEKIRKQDLLVLKKKKQSKSEELGLIIAGFVGGALAGAITALLLTPESGEDLRKRISGYVDEDVEDQIKEAAKTAKKKAAQAEKKLNDN